MLRRTGLAAVVLGGLWGSFHAQADNMSFHGTLIEQAPCVSNDGGDVNIDFGEMQVRDVAAGAAKYSKSFTILQACENPVTTLTVTQLGTATAFNSAAIQTNIADFGIELTMYDGQAGGANYVPLAMGVPFIYRPNTGSGASRFNLVFNARPAMRPGAQIETGTFTGISTLQVEYP